MSKRCTGECFDQEVCWIQAKNEYHMLVAKPWGLSVLKVPRAGLRRVGTGSCMLRMPKVGGDHLAVAISPHKSGVYQNQVKLTSDGVIEPAKDELDHDRRMGVNSVTRLSVQRG
jgi:hypothetical protein